MGAPSDSWTPAPAPSTTPKSHRWVYVTVAVVVVAIVVGSVLWYEYEPGGPQNPYRVHITEVIWTVDGGPFASSPGFSHLAGKSVSLSVEEYCYPGLYGEAQACGSGSVYIQTPGFGLVSTNAPFSWSSGTSDNGAGAWVDVTVLLPSTSYTGNLTINLQ